LGRELCLEDAEYRARVLQAHGIVENLEVKLDALERGSGPQQIAKAKANFGFCKGGPYY
jgi:hypothetical protein